ncbi:hypothetical protein IFM89_012634 [Coptis chinensis]|uniref:Uncharacterized protein n=1 Tax=Coptis chinensis TaxID=261450 RepID=A0A835IPS2_9MAGN|nr:hypothetical protein IFM89_012634 [Coptis chinensis]
MNISRHSVPKSSSMRAMSNHSSLINFSKNQEISEYPLDPSQLCTNWHLRHRCSYPCLQGHRPICKTRMLEGHIGNFFEHHHHHHQ